MTVPSLNLPCLPALASQLSDPSFWATLGGITLGVVVLMAVLEMLVLQHRRASVRAIVRAAVLGPWAAGMFVVCVAGLPAGPTTILSAIFAVSAGFIVLSFMRFGGQGVAKAILLIVGAGGLVAIAFLLIAYHHDPTATDAFYGLSSISASSLDLSQATLTKLPPLWVVFLVFVPLVVGYTSVMYFLERRTATPGTKIVLAVLRIAALALLVFLLFEPSLTLDEDTPRHSTVLVLIDTSASMNQTDLYLNRWRDDQGREHEAARSENSRKRFGAFVRQRLIAAAARQRADKPASKLDLLEGRGSGDFRGDLVAIARDISDFQARVSANRAETLAAATRAARAEVITAWLADRRATYPGERNALSGLIAAVNAGDLDAAASLVDRSAPAEAIAVLLARDLAAPGTLQTVAETARRRVTDQVATIARRESEYIAENAATAPVTTGGVSRLPDVYGPMDSFMLALQLERMLRLYRRIDALHPGIDLEVVLFLAETQARLVALQADLARGLREARDREAKANAQRQVAQLLKTVGARLDAELPRGPRARQACLAAVRHLLAISDGVRRIDVALELLHPEAKLGELLLEMGFSLPGALEHRSIEDGVEKKNTVVYATFANGLREVDLPLEALDLIVADGSSTAIGRSLSGALQDILKKHVDPTHLGAVVVISDGLNNEGPPTAAGLADVQVDTIAVGSTDTLRRLELFSLQGPSRIAKGQKLVLAVKIAADQAYRWRVDPSTGRIAGKEATLSLSRVVPDPEIVGREEIFGVPYKAMDVTGRVSASDTGPARATTPSDERGRLGVKLSAATPTQDLEFVLELDALKRPGAERFDEWETEVILRVKINDEKYPDEDTYKDNVREIRVLVTNKKTRVLYIEGRPRWEWRYLHTVLKREQSILFQGFLVLADPNWPQPASINPVDPPDDFGPLVRLPPVETEEDRQKFFDTYDVVIIGDVRPADDTLSPKFIATLEQFVGDKQGAVIFIAGEHYNPRRYGNTKLGDLLPVIAEPPPTDAQPDTTIQKPFVLTADGKTFAALQLDADPAKNVRLFRETIQGFYWYYPSPQLKPGAITLLAHPGEEGRRLVQTPDGQKYPLLVRMEYGNGNVIYAATDDFWYMRGGVGDRYYRPFWLRMIHWLAAEHRRQDGLIAEIYTENRNNPVYPFDYPIEVTARVLSDELFKTLEESGVIRKTENGLELLAMRRNISQPDAPAEPFSLRARAGRSDFTATLFPEEIGQYDIWIRDAEQVRHTFTVTPREVERQEKPLNLSLLAELAHGRPLGAGQVDLAPHCFRPPQVTELVVAPLSLPSKHLPTEEDLWDAPIAFAIIALLLALEWIIRKRGKLL